MQAWRPSTLEYIYATKHTRVDTRVWPTYSCRFDIRVPESIHATKHTRVNTPGYDQHMQLLHPGIPEYIPHPVSGMVTLGRPTLCWVPRSRRLCRFRSSPPAILSPLRWKQSPRNPEELFLVSPFAVRSYPMNNISSMSVGHRGSPRNGSSYIFCGS